MAPPHPLMMRLSIILSSADVKDRSDRLRALSSLTGRTITSMKEMTDDEAVDALALLESWKRNGRLFDAVTDLLDSWPQEDHQ